MEIIIKTATEKHTFENIKEATSYFKQFLQNAYNEDMDEIVVDIEENKYLPF